MRGSLTLCLLIVAVVGCTDHPRDLAAPGDLAIIHASVLDVKTGRVLPNRSVVITDGVITAVTQDTALAGASQVIDAHGRLLTPGFIDAHLHLCNVYYPPSCTSPRSGRLRLAMDATSLARHRRHLASLYLPHGVTRVRDAGSDEHVMPLPHAHAPRARRMPPSSTSPCLSNGIVSDPTIVASLH